MRLSIFLSLLFWSALVEARETITFPSGDGVVITADTYIQNVDPETPFIVLFHQASWSRGEYLETAPRLNSMGFNCMAVDQRSGGSINDVTNETKLSAQSAGKGTGFLDAIPDMLAAIAYAEENFSDGVLIGMGSSYSSALILKLAGDDAELVDAVASFSPSEYFSPPNLVRTSTANLAVPVFITSRKNEQSNWLPIFNTIPEAAGKTSFLPETSGQHGSRALWPEFSDSESYWDAFEPFLRQWLPSMANYRLENGLEEDGSEDLGLVDGSNVSHLMSYALGGGDLPVIVKEGGVWSFRFDRLKNRTDLVFQIEISGTTAGPWEILWSSEGNPYSAGFAASAPMQLRFATGEGRRFARLRVSVSGD